VETVVAVVAAIDVASEIALALAAEIVHGCAHGNDLLDDRFALGEISFKNGALFAPYTNNSPR